jgi:hypothetical protein
LGFLAALARGNFVLVQRDFVVQSFLDRVYRIYPIHEEERNWAQNDAQLLAYGFTDCHSGQCASRGLVCVRAGRPRNRAGPPTALMFARSARPTITFILGGEIRFAETADSLNGIWRIGAIKKLLAPRRPAGAVKVALRFVLL